MFTMRGEWFGVVFSKMRAHTLVESCVFSYLDSLIIASADESVTFKVAAPHWSSVSYEARHFVREFSVLVVLLVQCPVLVLTLLHIKN